ncbi:unnamed protein product [Peniophora sp. CBMAI 1063]|nr:unnamed protein product [Peniophora sp. CBMAI 1063]
MAAPSRPLWDSHLSTILSPFNSTSSTRSLTALSATREAVQLELYEARRATQRIATVWNAHTAICRLPQEVLENVFASLRDIYIPGVYGRPRLGYVVILHVCRLWREIALQAPRIWTYIELGLGSAWANRFLELSCTLPLKMDRFPNATSTAQALSIISQVLRHAPERITVLDLPNGIYDASELFGILSSCESPLHLGKLCISSEWTPRASLPLRIFEGVGHVGISEALTGASPQLDWSTLSRTIRCLELGFEDHSATKVEPCHGLFTALGQCVQLESLHIKSTFLEAIPVEGTIDLHCLQNLSLSGKASTVSAFLDAVVLSTTLNRLKLAITEADAANWTAIAARLQQGSGRLTSPAYRSLFLRGFTGSVHILASLENTGPLRPNRDFKRTYIALELSVQSPFHLGRPPRHDYVSIATNVLSSIDLSSLKTLHIDQFRTSPSHWLESFRHARALRHIVLKDPDTSLPCVIALGSSYHGETPSGAEDLLFPALQTLSFEGLDLAKPIVTEFVSGSVSIALGSTLATRVVLNCVPRSLVLAECKVEQQELQSWVDVVPAEMRDWTVDSLRIGADTTGKHHDMPDSVDR